MKNNVLWTVGAVTVGIAAAGALGFAAGKSKMFGTRRKRPDFQNTQRNMETNEDYTGVSEAERDIMAEVEERESG